MRYRAALVVCGTLAVVVVASVSSCAVLGERPSGVRLERIAASPQWSEERFKNPEKMHFDFWAAMGAAFSMTDESMPSTPVPHVESSAEKLAALPNSGLRVTWFGHSSSLVEIDGTRVLTDPVWSERASPSQCVGVQRWFPPVLALEALPPIDVVVISHDHYDHLDRATVTAIKDAVFVVPLGIGAHLAHWGIADSRIIELDWWQSYRVGEVDIVVTPARHTSGRVLPMSEYTLWAGFAMVGPAHRVYYSGDTGFQAAFATIGERYGPFDVTLIEAGQYNPAWPDVHLGPEQAVAAHVRLRGKTMLPVHWALFRLAPHTWTEPVERVLAAGRCAGVTVATPRPGESFEPDLQPQFRQWWPRNPWQPADEQPQRSTKNGVDSERYDVAIACH